MVSRIGKHRRVERDVRRCEFYYYTIKLYVYTTTDRRVAIGVFTRLRHGFPYGADWVEAPHATQGKRYSINNNNYYTNITILV